METPERQKPQPIEGVLRGLEGETRHVCWQCPACGTWWSDDYVEGDPNPLLTSCGYSRKHADGKTVDVSVSWVHESARDDPLERRQLGVCNGLILPRVDFAAHAGRWESETLHP
jgi:hypothetical protein